ncbi:MAG TPA: hypothetical protein VGM76_00655 [Lacipirellulaceae bacterium]
MKALIIIVGFIGVVVSLLSRNSPDTFVAGSILIGSALIAAAVEFGPRK